MIENCFLLYVVNSRLKKFFCCLLQGIFLSSQITNIYLTLYFSLVAICQWPLSSLRIPPDWLLCIPTRASPRKNFYPISQEPPTWKALPPNRTAKVIPFYYTTKLFTNFFRKKEKFIANTVIIKLIFLYIFSHKTNKSANDPNFQGNICVDNIINNIYSDKSRQLSLKYCRKSNVRIGFDKK